MARRSLDKAAVTDALLRVLRQEGPKGAGELPARLKIAHATLSRIIEQLESDVIRIGKGRATQYALRRDIGLSLPIALSEVLPDGQTRRLGHLTPIMPGGVYVEGLTSDLPTGLFPDLPFYLQDLRPAGFLGRLLPTRHPELALPADARLWSAEVCLKYFARHGWNLPGAIIVGEEAFSTFLKYANSPPDSVQDDRRKYVYPEMARNVMTAGVPGSSAAGEQPKFLATRASDMQAVLVKFSLGTDQPAARRTADLLVCEQLALETINRRGIYASKSQIIQTKTETFLEVERFDRYPGGGRRGTVSLSSLDGEFIGSTAGRWSVSVSALVSQKRVPKDALNVVRWLESFGDLIANTDMHLGNLSFTTHGAVVVDLAPVYDMTPMLYSLQTGQLVDRVFEPKMPGAMDGDVWGDALASATTFWKEVSTDSRISTGFRRIAKDNHHKMTKLEDVASRLPK